MLSKEAARFRALEVEARVSERAAALRAYAQYLEQLEQQLRFGRVDVFRQVEAVRGLREIVEVLRKDMLDRPSPATVAAAQVEQALAEAESPAGGLAWVARFCVGLLVSVTFWAVRTADPRPRP